MTKRLFYQQSEPGSRIAATAQRLSVKARIMMALFALMLIPQVTWAQDVDYFAYDTTTGKFVKTTATSGNYATLTGNSPTTLTGGTYVVNTTDQIDDRLDISGTVNIILCDGVTFTANKGITVSTGDVLNIYAQGEGTGKLIAYGFDNTSASGTLYAAIGGALSGSTHTSTPADYGYVNIYGGQITADASSITGASGIGAFDYSKSCVTTIYGGNVDAMGGPSGTNDTYGIAKLNLGSGVIYYGGSSPNPTTVVADGSQSNITTITTLYRYMSTKENVYNLTVDGKIVRTTNLNDILFSGGTTPTASFDPSANKLSLNGVDISNNISSNLPDLTVRFAGTNKINTDAKSSFGSSTTDNAIFSSNSSATLTIEKSGTGTSTLELDGKNTPKSAIAGFASVSYGDGCYLKTDVPTKYSSDDKCYINFANGNAPVDVVTISTDVYYPLWIGTSTTAATQVTTTAITTDVTFTPATATTSSKLSLSGVTLTGKILSALGDLVIEVSGENTISSPDSGTVIRSANAGTLTLVKAASNSSLQLKGTSGSDCPVIQGFHTLSYLSDFSLVTTPAASYDYDIFSVNSKNIYGLYYTSSNSAVIDALFTSVVSYGLSIAGTSITSVNKDNVFAGDALYDGKVTFLPDATTANSGTLTLTDFVKTSSNAAIVSSLDNLTVEFNGNCDLGDNGNRDGFVKSTNTNATLKFKGGTADSELILHATGKAVVQDFKSVSYEGAYWKYSGPITYKNSRYESENNPLGLLTITTTPQYLVWITDIQVASDNYDKIMGDASVTYDDASSTLTLDGCSISSMDCIKSALPVLNIKLKGHNTLFTYSSTRSPIVSSVSATLNIQKADGDNCSLTLKTMGSDPVVKGFDPNKVNYNDLDFVVTEGTGTTLIDNTVYGAVLRSLSFSGGAGTSGSPYLIATKEDLKELATVVNSDILDTSGKCFKVTDNIDCSGLTGFRPIGWNADHLFKGTFDGNGQTISNLQATNDYAGLFGNVFGGTVSNLTLHNFNIIADNDYNKGYAGALAGVVDGASTISNVKVTGTTTVSVSTPNGTYSGYAGAIFGYYKSGTLSNNSYEYTVTADGKTGYTPRGDGYSGVDITTSDGAVLYTQTLNTATIANGTIESWCSPTNTNTYTSNGKFVPGQTAYFKVTPATGYAIDASSPKVTYTAAGASQTINGALETSYSSDGVNVYSFTMPDAADVTATASMLVNISDAVYSATIDPGTYSPTGSLAPTTVKLTPKGSTSDIILNSPNDFTITAKTLGGTAAEFTNAGDYVVTIQGTGNYTGSRNVNYTINPKSVVGLEVNVSGTYTYTGSAIQPTSIEVKDGSKTLTSGTDYTIYTYSNNVDVADANDPSAPTVTIKGKGNYDINTTEDGHFTIAQADFSTTTSLSITAVTAQTYTGSEIKPTPTVTFNGKALTATVDFDYGYRNNKDAALSTDAAAPTVTVTGKGNFKGMSSVTFTIDQADFSLMSTPLTIATVSAETYTGSEIKPTPTVTFGSTQLTAGTDFDYSYANNTNAALSTATPAPTVTINGKGNFKGAKSVVFTIDQVDLSTSTDITIEAVPDQTYTGSAITPTPTVKFNGNDLVAGAGNDFVYSYLNNTNAALSTDPTAPPTVTITGSGNFKNSTSVKFTILDRTASVTFGSGQTYKTFFSAGENLLVPNDVKAYVVTMVSGNTVNLTQISYIHSNVPVLLESSAGATNVKDPNESLPATNLLKYASAAVSTDGNQYVLYSDEFVKATGTIPAGRVYLAYSSPVRRLTIERNNSATAIEAVSDEDAGDEQWYDMQGRKINKPTKDGLYIKNGKKVVVNNK